MIRSSAPPISKKNSTSTKKKLLFEKPNERRRQLKRRVLEQESRIGELEATVSRLREEVQREKRIFFSFFQILDHSRKKNSRSKQQQNEKKKNSETRSPRTARRWCATSRRSFRLPRRSSRGRTLRSGRRAAEAEALLAVEERGEEEAEERSEAEVGAAAAWRREGGGWGDL